MYLRVNLKMVPFVDHKKQKGQDILRVQRQYFEHPEMFSSGIPPSYFCDNSNSSFLKSENDTTMMGGPPECYSIGHYGMEI
jgi:hypothetical protein